MFFLSTCIDGIFTHLTEYRLAQGVVVDAYNDSVVEVRWKVEDAASNAALTHTVFWCQGSNTNHKCQVGHSYSQSLALFWCFHTARELELYG